MLRSLVALSLLIAAPAVPQTPPPLAHDTAARLKFPRSDGGLIDALAAMNRMVNASIQSESDQEHYGVADLWVMAPTDGKGDCEDYSLTKLFILQQAGFPIVTNTKIVAVMVHLPGREPEGHAILAVLLPSGEVAYLDNLRPELATRQELVRAGYQFFDWKA